MSDGNFKGGTPKEYNAWVYQIMFEDRLILLSGKDALIRKMAQTLPASVIYDYCFRGRSDKIPLKARKLARRAIQHICDEVDRKQRPW